MLKLNITEPWAPKSPLEASNPLVSVFLLVIVNNKLSPSVPATAHVGRIEKFPVIFGNPAL